ncbi:hypothetical protein ACLMJK_008609 [Lecanora helva]
MSATQLSFALSTSSKAKTVHLLGSWDNYSGQLPLSQKDKGRWKGTFRFSTSTLKPGSRYWYYYIVDGYQVSHDSSTSATKEPTTGRMLNILNVPNTSGGGAPASTLNKRTSTAYQAMEIPKGRSLSPSKIAHPKPSKPYASRAVREADYGQSPGVDELTGKLEQASLYSVRNISPPSSVGSSLSSSGSDRSSPSSLSSLSDPSSVASCRCERYGVTRSGKKVRLDCGGRICGYGDSSSDCTSSGSESSSEDERPKRYSQSSAKPRYQEIRPRQSAASGGRRR